jgi:hypothetical protein
MYMINLSAKGFTLPEEHPTAGSCRSNEVMPNNCRGSQLLVLYGIDSGIKSELFSNSRAHAVRDNLDW